MLGGKMWEDVGRCGKMREGMKGGREEG